MATSPRPDVDVRGPTHATGVYATVGGRLTGLVEIVLSRVGQGRFRMLERLTTGRSLLDIGCGKGRFVGLAKHRGWDAVGFETSETQAAVARKRFGIEVFCRESLASLPSDREHDVVTAWHVLEHVADPRAMLRMSAALLEPGGLLVLEVPNAGSWQASLGRGGWFQADVPRHLHHFRRANLERLLHQAGFRVLRVDTWSVELGPFGMLQTLLNMAGLPANALFCWLKRTLPTMSPAGVASLCLSAVLAPVAGVVELLAVAVGRGGVLRVTAVLEDAS